MTTEGLMFTAEHEWARVEGDIIIMGISDYAQEQLGEITFIELPSIGQKVQPKKEIAAIESAKAASDVYSPVAGEIVEVNEALESSPETINQDCYGGGWICKIKISGPVEGLMSSTEYDEYLKGL